MLRFARLLTVVALVVAGITVPSLATPAVAAGSPDVQLTKSVDADTLYGRNVDVTLTATQTTGPTGFNLTFTDVIPPGATLVSSTFAVSEQIVLVDGSTKLIWSNVADLQTGALVTLDYRFAYPTATYNVGDVFAATAEAYANADPRFIAHFDPATGDVTPGTFTGSATASASTTLVPFIIEKDEPSAESELLRGVHDHKTVYTLTLTNNLVTASTNFSIVDFLPAGLEFLGCANVDNSAIGTEEYPGAGRIDDTAIPALTNCIAPASVTTVTTDPDGAGSLPAGVYTRVEWLVLGGIAAGGSLTIDYAAAIPLRENVQSAGVATANLDNNTGALTADEQLLRNFAQGSGTFEGSPYTVDDTEDVVAEDVSIHKSVDTAVIAQGGTSTWTLFVESSEYATQTGAIVVTDTIPDGLDYGSGAPTETGVVAGAGGTLVATWSLTGFTAPSSTATIVYTTTTRTTYRLDGGPVSANDSWTNTVALATTSDVVTSNDGSTTNLALPDESEASQRAEGVTLAKEVAEPSASPVACATDALTWNDDLAGDFHPGDRVCFRLSATFPPQLDTLDNVVTDYLPNGFSFESFVYTPASTVQAGEATFTGDGTSPVLSWALPAVDIGELFQVIVSTRITDATAARDGDITANLLKMVYRNSLDEVFQLRDEADVTWARPEIALSKGIMTQNAVAVPGAPVSALGAQANDVLEYQVTVTNAGTQQANSVSVRDVLPPLWTCADISSISDSGTCVSDDWIQWDGLTVAALGSIDLDYTVTIPIAASPGDDYLNTAGVRTFQSVTNTGTPFVYVPESNIDPTLASAENIDPAEDEATVSIDAATIVKTGTTSVTEAGNTVAQATIGEIVTYTVTVTVPEGSTLYETPTVRDVVDSRLTIIGTPTYTVAGGAPQNATVAGQTITAALPATYANAPGSGDDLVVLTFDARVDDVSGPVRGNQVPNAATFSWSNAVSDDSTITSATVQTRIVEPNLSILKTSNDADGQVTPGQTITYQLAVTNLAGTYVSTAHDLVVVDVIPADLDPVSYPGGTWDAGNRTLTFSATSLAPGVTTNFSYTATVRNPVVSAGSILNTATVTGTSLAGTPTGERTSTSALGGPGSGYQAASSVTVTAPVITVAKSATPTTRTVGQAVSYTLDVTIPASVTAHDVTVIDTLPGGTVFESLDSVDCVQAAGACSPDVSATVIGPPVAGDPTIGFFLGDLDVAATDDRLVTITYTAWVADTAGNGDTLVNSARPHFNSTDRIAGTPPTVPPAASFDVNGDPSTASVSIVEPRVVIDKDVAGQVGDTDTRRAKPGDSLAYTIIVTNAGTSPAYDLTVADTPDPRLTGFSNTGAGTVTDGDPSDGTLGWVIPGPIAPGASVTIGYTLTIPAGLDESDEVLGAELVNTADVPSYFGVDDIDQEPGRDYIDYDDVTPDLVSIELDLASIGDFVWFDVDGDGVQDAGEPSLPGIDVTVLFAGADGTLGTGDDESVTTTTDAAGAWLVEHLPGGTYRVTVDATDLPSGLAPSYDLDGGVATPNGQWVGALSQGQAKRDADFGYTGTGSIGDRVWFDQDLDGVQDAAEPGLPGATVTVTWGGFDGDLATTGDNIEYALTTGSNGGYLADDLPAGPYSVVVTGLPSGYSVVSGPNGTSNSNTVALAAGQDLLTQDFGYAGTGSIGNYVWLDRDGDGVQDAAEDPIEGAVVQLTWLGVDGVAGGSDDATFQTVTDAAGAYLFGNLLPGNYVVAVVGALPAAVTNSYDEDGNGDSATNVSLAIGQAHLTADFGYDVESALGDRVWWDRDSDGVQDAGEPGIPGVTVTATYFGADGVLGGGDDLAFTDVTDAGGAWTLVDVPDGNYRIDVTSGVPAGFGPTYDPDSGIVAPDESTLLTLTTANLNQDFGYAGALSLGDTVWLDLDGDGAQDVGEPGLPGITIELTWFGPDGVAGGGDDVELSTVTDINGTYSFPGLPAGNFSVAVDAASVPAGLIPSYDLDGGDDLVTLVTLVATSLSTVDFGLEGTSSIGDLVWHDRDGDGSVDAGESGIPGVTIALDWAGPDGTFGTADDESFSTVTDADGAYLFDGIPAGEYVVGLDESTLPSGFVSTFDEDGNLDSTAPVTLAAADDHLTADFGYRGGAEIGDLVWLDLDGDGARDAGEPGVPAQPVLLRWAGADGVLDTADDETWATVTDAAGAYLFEFLPDGAFRVTIDGGIADAATNSADPDAATSNEAAVTITAGASNLDQDFGYHGANGVGDTVWWDRDGDGVDEAGEPRLPGVDLAVTWFGPDGVAGGGDDVTLPTTTDASGLYFVDGLPDGSYRIEVVGGVIAGLSPSVDPDAVADGVTELALSGATTDLDQDFGYVGAGAIGNAVWLDANGDGTKDPGEAGIPNATVVLTWAGPDGALDTADDVVSPTTTDANGAYLFDRLAQGDFRVEVTNLPAGITSTADPDGGADDQSELLLGTGESNLDQDFGYVGSAGVGDTLWLDVDGDDVQDAGEPGIAGVVIEIRLPGADGAIGTADDVIVVRTTDADGKYLAEGLTAGPVRVSYDPTTLAAGLEPTADLDGGNFATTDATLVAGETRLDVDFVVSGTATLSGLVFNDGDGDGVQDPSDPGIAGVVLRVTWQGPIGDVTIVVTTGPDGRWSLGGLPAGSYRVALDLSTTPEGYRPSTGVLSIVQLAPGGTGYVEQGLTTLALAITGTEITMSLFAGGSLLAAGLFAFVYSRRRARV